VSVLSLDTDDYREAVGALSELVEVKCGSVRPICNLVSELVEVKCGSVRPICNQVSELVEVKCRSVRPICNLVSELFVLLQSSGHYSTHALTHDTELGNCFVS